VEGHTLAARSSNLTAPLSISPRYAKSSSIAFMSEDWESLGLKVVGLGFKV